MLEAEAAGPDNPDETQTSPGRLVRMIRSHTRPRGPAIAAMNLPDLKPWFDNVSDDYQELPADDHDTAYDE